MNATLTIEEVDATLRQFAEALPHAECRTCECLQGFLTQLGLDASEDAGTPIRPWLIARGEMHGCLGCDPCLPGDRFMAYLRGPNSFNKQPIILLQV